MSVDQSLQSTKRLSYTNGQARCDKLDIILNNFLLMDKHLILTGSLLYIIITTYERLQCMPLPDTDCIKPLCTSQTFPVSQL